MKSNWKFKDINGVELENLSEHSGCSPFLAKLLAIRGISTPLDANNFLSPGTLPIPDPFLFCEMETAVQRIFQARDKNERVLIYGDYDVDGITSTCIMLETLWDMGIQADRYIPDRLAEGYGLHSDLIHTFANEYDLMITVDCGTTAFDAIQIAQKENLDVIITDHHEPGVERPPALALLNPQFPHETYPSKCLSGAGVAWKLASALRASEYKIYDENAQLELVALGMIADIVPLYGENRTLLTRAFERFYQTDRPGLAALMEMTKVIPSRINTGDIGFRITPRMNAAGRMATPDLALELLLTRDEARAWELAKYLNELNAERRTIEKQVFEEACRLIEANALDQRSDRVLMVVGEGWHRGVIGLASQKLVKQYARPVFIFSQEDHHAVGSARTYEGIDLIPIIDRVRPYTLSCGGHAGAAGIKIDTNHIQQFEKALYEAVDDVWPQLEHPTIWLDDKLPLERIDFDLMSDIERLQPFGTGNDEPLFYAHTSLEGFSANIVGNNHLRMKLRHPRGIITAIAFNQGHRLETLKGDEIELAFHCRTNEFNGQKSVDLHLFDFSSTTRTISITTMKDNSTAAATLTRETLLNVFAILEKTSGDNSEIAHQHVPLLSKLVKLSNDNFNIALQIFTELELISIQDGKIIMNKRGKKKNLTDSPTFRTLNSK